MSKSKPATSKTTLQALIRDALATGRYKNETSLAAAANVSVGTINQLKNGRCHGVSRRLLPDLAKALGISDTDLTPFLSERYQP